jgi:hypothetical protein
MRLPHTSIKITNQKYLFQNAIQDSKTGNRLITRAKDRETVQE